MLGVNVTAVNVTINDKAYAVKAEGTVDIDTTALDADTYTVVVSNAENGVYNANSTSKFSLIIILLGLLTFIKPNPLITISWLVYIIYTP